MPVALVTGSTAGIGRAIAHALGREGYSVGVCGRSADRVGEPARRARALPASRPPASAADVAEPGAVSLLVRHVTEALGPVDVLVNNAGIGFLKPFSELTLEEWDRTMATNLRSMYVVTREVLPGMRVAGTRGRHQHREPGRQERRRRRHGIRRVQARRPGVLEIAPARSPQGWRSRRGDLSRQRRHRFREGPHRPQDQPRRRPGARGRGRRRHRHAAACPSGH